MYQDNRLTNDSIQRSREAARLRVPSTLSSMGMEFAETATQLPRLGFDVMAALQGLPARNPLDDSFEIFHEAMNTPNESWTQETADFFATGIGYLSPLNAGTGTISAINKGVSSIATRFPEALSPLARVPIKNFGLKFLPTTIGEAGKQISTSFLAGTALTAPEALLDTYDKSTGTFQLAGAATQAFSNGVLAIGLDALPVTAGLIFGKHKKRIETEYENPMPGESHKMGEFDTALTQGHITKDEHDWIKTYLEDPTDVKALNEKGLKILTKEGYPVDHAQQKVMMSILKKDHYDNFHTAILDQISSGANEEFSTSLSDYVAASSMDFMRSENGKLLDGIDGYISFMDKKLATSSHRLEEFKKARSKTGLEHMESEHPMTQKNLLQNMKSVDFDLQRLPHAIPKNLRFRAIQEQKLIKLKSRLSKYKKLENHEKVESISKEIEELKSSKESHLPVTKELSMLEEHFLGKEKLPKNYKQSHDYHRLIDIAHFSTKAEGLLHHIQMKDHFETQQAYLDTVKFLKGIIESNVTKFADPNKVVNYFKSRMDSVGKTAVDMSTSRDIRTNTGSPIEPGKTAFSAKEEKRSIEKLKKEMKENVQDYITTLQSSEEDVRASREQNIEADFKKSKTRYTQFKDSETVLSQLISCELGSTGEV